MCVFIDLVDGVKNAQQINVYNDGNMYVCNAGENAFNDIVTAWSEMTRGSHEMPAFGVSLDRETKKAKSSGVWVEFVFGKKLEYNEMPFENLLVNVQKSFHGFNIIRYTSKCGYDGRCFYLDILSKDMSNLYEVLSNVR